MTSNAWAHECLVIACVPFKKVRKYLASAAGASEENLGFISAKQVADAPKITDFTLLLRK